MKPFLESGEKGENLGDSKGTGNIEILTKHDSDYQAIVGCQVFRESHWGICDAVTGPDQRLILSCDSRSHGKGDT